MLAVIVCLGTARGADIDHKDLLIAGLSLEVDTTTVVANVGIPAAVQTKFGGKINDEAPPDNGMTAIGDLTGPGIDVPIRLVTKPGHLFELPALNEKGDYILRNIRLVSADGKVLQTAVPSFANITVAQVLDTKLSVRQLTPDDLRARGITVDANNYDVYVRPETIRAGEEYTAYAFITNTSATAQTIRLDVGQIPVCSGDSAWSNFNVCFPAPMDAVEATIDRRKTLTVPYHLKSRLTGSVFASAGSADDNIKVGVSLSMGVSTSGIPLSPATLLMPWYTRYVDPDFVAAQLTLLGLGYSLATAGLSERTALLPRVIQDDVFRRAQNIARAGEPIIG